MTAFHPRVGNVRVRAADVRHGFIAFSYANDFQNVLDDRSIEALRRGGSRNNIRNGAIKFLARYVKERLRRSEALQALELQFLAVGTYVETMRQLDTVAAAPRDTLSDQEFERLCDFIEGNLEDKLSCADLSCAVNMPLRAVYQSVKLRTGRSQRTSSSRNASNAPAPCFGIPTHPSPRWRARAGSPRSSI